MSKKRRNKQIKKLRKFFQQKVASQKESLLKEVEIEANLIKKTEEKNKFQKEVFLEKIKDKSEKIKINNFFTKDKFRKQWIGIGYFLKKMSTRLVETLKKWNNIFCEGMTCRTNLKRDAIIISVAILVAAVFLGLGQYTQSAKNKIKDRKNEVLAQGEVFEKFEEENINEVKTIQEQFDVNSWKEFKSNWYGFKIKYPEGWGNPTVLPYKSGSKADYRVAFLHKQEDTSEIKGFEVAVYDVKKVKDIFSTNEFPQLKEDQVSAREECSVLTGHLIETGDYPAEEIYIPAADNCYQGTLFFSVIVGQFMYNIYPSFKEGANLEVDPMVKISDELPEFFAAVSSFENIEIIRPKPAPVKPKINAPKPASYKVVNGRLVCEKKNDKPGKSDKGKGKHLDMECCLDPDEYPNPHCYYDPAKYGKYLK